MIVSDHFSALLLCSDVPKVTSETRENPFFLITGIEKRLVFGKFYKEFFPILGLWTFNKEFQFFTVQSLSLPLTIFGTEYALDIAHFSTPI